MTEPSRKRLLLVEDNPVFLEQISLAINQLPDDWEVVSCPNGSKAMGALDGLNPVFDLVLVDIGLPDISGIEVIRAWHKRYPDTPIVVISVMTSEPVVLSAIEAGAKGYILKGDSLGEITHGIAQVMNGIYPLSPSLARFLFKKLTKESAEDIAVTENDFKLTPRELETLSHLSQGLSYEGVAEQMNVALSTIQWNVRNLYRKLNVRSQVQAITKARNHDLI